MTTTPAMRALEALFATGNVYHARVTSRPMNIEDCWRCGINRSICMDKDCPGDHDLLVAAGFYE